MCGLAGYFVFDDRAPVPDARVRSSLGAALAHRGPDGGACHASRDGRAALVHRRLAIIDLTEAGDQPMALDNGRYQLVFNGEIYNYRELRARLEGEGERFSSASDTEVLLRLLARRGPAALSLARGMFAIALWDEAERTLLLARDRFGIKPLYVAAAAGRVAFASEVGALWRAGLVNRVPSAAGVLAYLSWASVPAPLTWVEGVESLEPGTWRRWAGDGSTTGGRFADVRDRFHRNGQVASEAELRARVSEAVRDTVRAHLVADVPVGVFLSGGIDSSSVVSAARSVTTGELRTYTVVPTDQAFSEDAIARKVSQTFGTEHHVLALDAAHLGADLPHILRHLDQPTADAINSYYVSRAVAQTGLKAVLSGTGADELFGGYPSFRRLPWAARMKKWTGPALASVGPLAGARLPAWRRAKWRHFCEASTMTERYRAQRGLFMPGELPDVAGPALRDPAVWAPAVRTLEAVERASLGTMHQECPEAAVARLETRHYLGSQLLRDIDAMSMSHSLEVRVPFVDHELLGAVWPDLGGHVPLMRNKRLLYETLAAPLPVELYDRPKQGFLLPFTEWMRGDLKDVIRGGARLLERDGWIAPGVGAETWRQWEAGQGHWSRPWALGILGAFLEAE